MKKFFRFLVPVGLLAIGIAVMAAFVATKPEAKKKPKDFKGTLVETKKVSTQTRAIEVEAYGMVIPARQVVISPEVTGRVTWMHKDLVPGGKLKKGQSLLRVYAYDYVLAAQELQARVDSARTELQLERSRKKVAEKEWKLMGGKPVKDDSLALRGPQLKTAQAALKSARSGLQRARLSVGRTLLKVRFNAVVQQRGVEIGQLVGPSSPLVTLVGTDAYWVQVSVPTARLPWIRVPGLNGTDSSDVVVSQTVGDERIERNGKVVRLLSDLDPAGKMARLVVRIEDPLGLKKNSPNAGKMPLLLGSFVKVSIRGRAIDNVAAVPRDALRDGDKVYLVGADTTLVVKPVNVVWRKENEVFVSKGLQDGHEVIVSPVPNPVPGMKLRRLEINVRDQADDDDANKADAGASKSKPKKQPDKAPKPKAKSAKKTAQRDSK